MKFHYKDKFSSQWINIKIFMNMHHNYEFLYNQELAFRELICIPMDNFHHNDIFSSQWWILKTMINFHHNDEFSSLSESMMKDFHHNAEFPSFNEFSSQW